jgi:hypothetical protein
MSKFKYYRWLRVLFGARSFVKEEEKTNTYVLIWGKTNAEMIMDLQKSGFKEEWPLDYEED